MIFKYQARKVPHITGLIIVDDQTKIKRRVIEGHKMKIRDITHDLKSGKLHPKIADVRIRGICAYSIGILEKIHPRLQKPLKHYNPIRA